MRIIAGEAKGRKIETVGGLSTRPSSEKTREAVFGSIQFQIAGSGFLDVFSGSGAFALEAISRGAGRTVCNDIDPKSIDIIMKNATKLGFIDRLEIKRMDYKTLFVHLSDSGAKFDFVFLDPPYKSGFIADCVERIMSENILNDQATIMIEYEDKNEVNDISINHETFKKTKDKKYGNSYISYFVYRGV